MNKKAFTLVELVVVVVILTILSTLGFISYSSYLVKARDSQRKSDISQISSALLQYKSSRGLYPINGKPFNILYGTEMVAKQGIINNEVKGLDINKLPLDPRNNKNYIYSITKNRQEFQLATTLENGGNNIALVTGNYKTVSKNILPTIVLATENNIDISLTENKNKFIFDGQGYNLPYNIVGEGVKSDGTGGYLTEEIGKDTFWQNSDFRNCIEIKEAGKILLENNTLEYQILNINGNLENKTCSGSLKF